MEIHDCRINGTVPAGGQSSPSTSSGAVKLGGLSVLCVTVFMLLAAACHSGALVPFPSAHGAGRYKFCHALNCHAGCYLSLFSLPACLLICSLSEDIIYATEGEKSGISLYMPPRRLSEPQLLLQVNQELRLYMQLLCYSLLNNKQKKGQHNCCFQDSGM